MILHCNEFLWSDAYTAGTAGTASDIHLQNVLHYIAKSNCNRSYGKMVFYNIKANPRLIQQKDRSGKTPLEVAFQSGTRGGKAIIEEIIEFAKKGAAASR